MPAYSLRSLPGAPITQQCSLLPTPRSNSHCKGLLNTRIASSKGPSSNNHDASAENQLWQSTAFPHYLQESVEASDFCSILEEARIRADSTSTGEHSNGSSALWRTIRRECERDAKTEPLLSSFLYASILSHDSFERSLAFVLSNRLSNAILLPTELFEVFYSILSGHREIAAAALADLCAVRERDPACASYSQALLHFKGFHAIQVYRIAHSLWTSGRRVLAVALQSRCSEVFAVDIHPAAKIGRGVLLDHGTGVVIGETAHVGNNVSILQNVTLGGTGKEHGDRHPKVSDNVLIGASATILGNILIGKGAQVAAGSLVLKPVPPKTMVAGSPAKEVGTISGNPALSMKQWRENSVALAGSEAITKLEEPCDDIFAAAPSTANGPTAKKQEEKSRTRIIDGQAATIVNGVTAKAATEVSSSLGEVASMPTASTAPKEDLKAAIVDDAAQREKNTRKKSGAPPAVEQPVDSVLSDTEAKNKWGGKVAGDDMEYTI